MPRPLALEPEYVIPNARYVSLPRKMFLGGCSCVCPQRCGDVRVAHQRQHTGDEFVHIAGFAKHRALLPDLWRAPREIRWAQSRRQRDPDLF